MVPQTHRATVHRRALAVGAFLRDRAGGVLAFAVTTLVCLWVYASDVRAHQPGSDGFYSWLWARSIAFDHDVDFANDYAVCGDPARVGVDRGTGHVDNPFYAGPALIWAPLLAVLRLVITVAPDASVAVRAGCTGPLAAWTLASGALCAGLTAWLSYLVARRWVGDAPAALGAFLLGLGGNLLAYATVLSSYSHVHEAVWFAWLLHASVRAVEAPERPLRWVLAGLATSACTLQRVPDAALGLVPFAALVVACVGKPRRDALVLASSLLVPASLGLLATAAIYQRFYGTVFAMPQGRYYVQLGHAHPWLLLFGPHGGLFFVTPAAWLSVLGLPFFLRKRALAPVALGSLGAFVVVLYVASSALDWHGAGTYGARRLVVVTALFAVTASLALDAFARWVQTRPGRLWWVLGAVALPVAFGNLGATWALPRERLPIHDGSSQAGLYGEGTRMAWSLVDERVGDVAVLPAAALFRLRYGLPMNAWRAATADRYYTRHYRSLAWSYRGLSLSDDVVRSLVLGARPAPQGMLVVEPRARLVFAAGWPFATSVVVRAKAARPASLRVGLGHLTGVTWGGRARIEAGETAAYRLELPAGAWDSGLVELVFEVDDVGAGVVLERIEPDDEELRPPPTRRHAP